jgi:hypothetical protein
MDAKSALTSVLFTVTVCAERSAGTVAKTKNVFRIALLIITVPRDIKDYMWVICRLWSDLIHL